jgi:hypothetical protein
MMRPKGVDGSTPSVTESPLNVAPGVGRFTVENVKPHLRRELNRRIMAIAEESADLIGSDREAVIKATLTRCAAWITLLPSEPGDGTSSPSRWTQIKSRFTWRNQPEPPARRSPTSPKELADLPHEERWRLVMLQQGLQLNAAVSAIIAEDAGAIAGKWFSHWRQAGYDYREVHKERDGKIYLVRNSWARERGLVVVGDVGYTDDISQPADEIGCRCQWVWLYHLRQLPPDTLTKKGCEELKRAHAEIERVMKDSS